MVIVGHISDKMPGGYFLAFVVECRSAAPRQTPLFFCYPLKKPETAMNNKSALLLLPLMIMFGSPSAMASQDMPSALTAKKSVSLIGGQEQAEPMPPIKKPSTPKPMPKP